LYATVRHSLFGVDRLLNRALVYALLSLGILLLYLGLFVAIYRFLPGDPLLQMMAATGLTLLVGVSFNELRAWVQRLVDHLFYGGWYDYASVVEAVSDALARTLDRDRLIEVLTHQVPTMMHLHPGRLEIGEPGELLSDDLPPSPTTARFRLTFRGQTRAVWTAGPRRDGDDLSTTDRRILQTLARQAEVALGNVLLIEALRRRLDEIRAVQNQLLRSREEERARLARELHDSPIQLLIGLNMQLGLLLAGVSSEELETSCLMQELTAVRAQVRRLLSDLRQVCAELRPPLLDTLGLGAALRALLDEWSAQSGVEACADLSPDEVLRALPDEVSVNLYRVVQEALTNVARHADARRVTLRLTWEEDCLVLTIQDDGRGFVPVAPRDLVAQGHFGLAGMQERVALIGGTLTVESAPGRGTTVRVDWP
ncbi:MAG: sensor histidine kinase, partial [Chloroflexi bacterium]